MKKRLTISLAAVAILLIAVAMVFIFLPKPTESPVKEIKIKDGTVNTEYTLNETIDYSKIVLVVTKEDGTSAEVKLTDKGVEYNVIDTAVAGEKTLTVKYEGKEYSVSIEIIELIVQLELDKFSEPQAYLNYLEHSKVKDADQIAEDEFAKKGNPYVIGSLNKFEFVPEVEDIEANVISNPQTTYKLFVKDSAEDTTYDEVESPDTYVLVEQDNMYKFTSSAVGKFLKLEIYPDTEVYDVSTLPTTDQKVEIEFVVKEAYNVYDTLGLSVLDNLNINNWAKLKDQQLKWDDKKLSAFTDVELIVIHNDIAINPDQLPSNYFWSEDLVDYQAALTRAQAIDNNYGQGGLGYADRLKGSLRDGVANGESNSYTHGGLVGDVDYSTYAGDTQANTYKDGTKIIEAWQNENMQKGLFNTNQCSISGNYMQITLKESETRHLTTVVSSDNGDGNNGTAPVSHWALFKFFKNFSEGELNLTVENISLVGNMGKGNNMSVEAGLNGINTVCDQLNIENVKTTKFYIHITVDKSDDAECVLNFSDSRMTNAYSSMFYLWRSKVNVVNSIMENAGGPLFLMLDADRDINDQPENGDDGGPVLKVDDKSRLASYATGEESWYQMYNATMLLTQGLAPINTGLAAIGKTFIHNKEISATETAPMINVIAALIPNAGSIVTPPSDVTINICGKFVREFSDPEKDAEVFALNSPASQAIKSFGSVGLISGAGYAYLDAQGGLGFMTANELQDPYMTFATSSSDMLAVLMSASLLGIPGAPYFSIIVGDYLPIAG